MKELYLANMWPQIVTERGVRLLGQKGYNTSGNWLNGNSDYINADRIVLPFADFGQPLVITEATPKLWRKVVSYILFPDASVGWDVENKRYLFQKNPVTEGILLKSLKRLSHSNYSSMVIDKTYGNMQNITIPLGVDTDSIGDSITQKHTRLRVLWNHMWRSDKGAFEAFDLVSDLATIYPKVEFWFGQMDTWDFNRDGTNYKDKCVNILKRLRCMDNVHFFKRIENQKNYWAWLNQADISFSTAFQEGFGLSMMEQEAAGIACVVPNAEVYPELHAGCLIMDRSKLIEGLQILIEDSNMRKLISQGCLDNASKYDTSIWIESFMDQLK